MVLSNAERQARYRQRLKDAAAAGSLVRVRVYEGPFEEGWILHDMLMPVVPRVDEVISLRLPDRSVSQYKVVAVDYLIEIKDKSIEIDNDFVGAQISVKGI